jgi:hypothetical protein
VGFLEDMDTLSDLGSLRLRGGLEGTLRFAPRFDDRGDESLHRVPYPTSNPRRAPM